LDHCNFSVDDDDYSRALKYQRLALLLKDLGTGPDNLWKVWAQEDPEDFYERPNELKWDMVYEAYRKSLQHLQAMDSVPEFEKPNFDISRAQIKLWMAHSLLRCDPNAIEKAIKLEWSALELLKDAEIKLL